MFLALIFASVQSMVSYFGGAPLILRSVHGQPLTPDTPKHQMVLNVIQEMAVAARLPVPTAYFIPDSAPNAFATGRNPEHSIICVTQGLIDNMDREELQGVIGHEMSHIADYDIRTMMMVAVLVSAGSRCSPTPWCGQVFQAANGWGLRIAGTAAHQRPF